MAWTPLSIGYVNEIWIMKGPRPLELLAPARDRSVAMAAISHGADAVYIGGPTHGARVAASNTIADIAAVVEYAHQFGARVYVTVNTLVYDSELNQVEQSIWDLWRAGVDALIVQDLGLLRMHLPPVDLHASTQCDIRTPEKAAFLSSMGFSQLVLPREATLDEIRDYSAAVPGARLEAFVHGALCVSYSGDCQASFVCTGRSANRGECSQICRLAYSLFDEQGKELVAKRHLLSLRDLNRLDVLGQMADAGISSFKIEGRLKDSGYVKNVVAAYRRGLDALIEVHPERYCHASAGSVATTFTPDPSKSFNRGFTSYFLSPPKKSDRMANILTPKSVGEPVGTTRDDSRNGVVAVEATKEIAAGDGLCFFDAAGQFHGFRVNRYDMGKSLIHMGNHRLKLPRNTRLYRNHDQVFETLLARNDTAERTIAVDAVLRSASGSLIIDLVDETGVEATVAVRLDSPLEESRTDQEEVRRRNLAKTGGTVFKLRTYDDRLGALFVPSSLLGDLRRRAYGALASARQASFIRLLRRPETQSAQPPEPHLDYHHNVANRLARQVYLEHGASGQQALEVEPQLPTDELRVMTTRYCVRRELGLCRRPSAPSLWLQAEGNVKFRLDFDCPNCRMFVVKERESHKSANLRRLRK